MPRPHDAVQDELDNLTELTSRIKAQAARVRDCARYPSMEHEEEVSNLLELTDELP